LLVSQAMSAEMSIRTLDLQVLLMEEPWTSTLGECLPQAVRALSA